MMPSGHKAFVVNNVNDVELLLMHNRTHAAEYVPPEYNLECLGYHRTARTIANSVAGSPTPSPRGRGSTSSAARSSWVSRSRIPRRRSRPRYKRNAGVTVRSRRGVQLSGTGGERRGEEDDDGDGGGRWGKRENTGCYLGPAVFFNAARCFHVASIGMHRNKRFALRFSEWGRWLRETSLLGNEEKRPLSSQHGLCERWGVSWVAERQGTGLECAAGCYPAPFKSKTWSTNSTRLPRVYIQHESLSDTPKILSPVHHF